MLSNGIWWYLVVYLMVSNDIRWYLILHYYLHFPSKLSEAFLVTFISKGRLE